MNSVDPRPICLSRPRQRSKSRQRRLVVTGIFLAALFFVRIDAVDADIIYDSGVELASINDSILSDDTFGMWAGDYFTLGTNSVINEVHWTGSYQNRYFGAEPPATDDFTIEILDFAGGLPGATLHTFSVGNSVNRIDTGVMPGAFQDAFAYHASLPDTSLAPGSYLLSIFNRSSGQVADLWLWSEKTDRDGGYYRRDGLWKGPERTRTDFTLYGSAVPEPSTAVLGLIGLAVIAGSRWRRTRAGRN